MSSDIINPSVLEESLKSLELNSRLDAIVVETFEKSAPCVPSQTLIDENKKFSSFSATIKPRQLVLDSVERKRRSENNAFNSDIMIVDNEEVQGTLSWYNLQDSAARKLNLSVDSGRSNNQKRISPAAMIRQTQSISDVRQKQNSWFSKEKKTGSAASLKVRSTSKDLSINSSEYEMRRPRSVSSVDDLEIDDVVTMHERTNSRMMSPSERLNNENAGLSQLHCSTVSLVRKGSVNTTANELFARDFVRSKMQQALQALPLFENFGLAFYKQLAERMTVQTFKENEFIIRKGDIGYEMYYLNKGLVSVVSGDGKTVFTELKEGTFFGEVGVLFACPRTASVAANEVCELYKLTKSDLEVVLLEFPKISAKLQEMASKKMNEWLNKEKYTDFDKEFKLDRVWLKFPSKIEEPFREELSQDAVVQFRYSLACLAAFALITLLFERVHLNNGRITLLAHILSRLVFVLLAIFLAILSISKTYQYSASLRVVLPFVVDICCGICAVIILPLAERWTLPPLGLMVVIFGTFAIVPMRFWWLTLANWINVLIYFVALIVGNSKMTLWSSDQSLIIAGNIASVIIVTCAGMYYTYFAELSKRKVFIQNHCLMRHQRQLQKEKEKADNVLLSIFPRNIALALRDTSDLDFGELGRIHNRSFESASVLSADIVGFTPMSSSMDAPELVNFLNDLFISWDAFGEQYGVEKIKTIGDCYIACAGVPEPNVFHAQSVVLFGLDMISALAGVCTRWNRKVDIRVGISSGKLFGGVIGTKKVVYDVWGPAFSSCNLMEQTGRSNSVHVSKFTHILLTIKKPRDGIDFLFEDAKQERFENTYIPTFFVIQKSTEYSGFNYMPSLSMQGTDVKYVSSSEPMSRSSSMSIMLLNPIKKLKNTNFLKSIEKNTSDNKNKVGKNATLSIRSDSDVMFKKRRDEECISHVSNVSESKSNTITKSADTTSFKETDNDELRWYKLRFEQRREELYTATMFSARIESGFRALISIVIVTSFTTVISAFFYRFRTSYSELIRLGIPLPITIFFTLLFKRAPVRHFNIDCAQIFCLFCLFISSVIENFVSTNVNKCGPDCSTEKWHEEPCCRMNQFLDSFLAILIVLHVMLTHVRALIVSISTLLALVFSTVLCLIAGDFYCVKHKFEGLPYLVLLWLVTMLASIVMELNLRLNYVRAKVVQDKAIEVRELERRSDNLLLNVLPSSIARRMKNQSDGHEPIADYFPDVTILFAEVSSLPEDKENESLRTQTLHNVISLFDKAVESFGCEKIKLIGQTYMAVSGCPAMVNNHAQTIASLALVMNGIIHRYNMDEDCSLELRCGINSGPIVAGVIGNDKFLYDIYGDSVNVSSRMYSSCPKGCIQVSASSYEVLKEQFLLEKRGVVIIKGKGAMETYYLIDKQADIDGPTQEALQESEMEETPSDQADLSNSQPKRKTSMWTRSGRRIDRKISPIPDIEKKSSMKSLRRNSILSRLFM